MREIHKKINREYFEAIQSGQKTFEFRVADFDCESGDILVLEEWEYENGYDDTIHRHPTGRELRKKVGYVAKSAQFDWLGREDVEQDLGKYGFQIISLVDSSQPNDRKLVVISGSLKFYDKMQEIHEQLELENGWAVIGVTPHVMTRDFTPAEEDLLDDLHRAKIRLADAIFVVNVNGYIGKSTQAEIDFAKALGKEVLYLEPPTP